MVLIGNKCDQKDRKVKARQITFHRSRNLQYYDISAKSNYQYEKPFLWILRTLVGDPNLFLTEEMSLTPPEIMIDEETLKNMQQDILFAQNCQLPEDEE